MLRAGEWIGFLRGMHAEKGIDPVLALADSLEEKARAPYPLPSISRIYPMGGVLSVLAGPPDQNADAALVFAGNRISDERETQAVGSRCGIITALAGLAETLGRPNPGGGERGDTSC